MPGSYTPVLELFALGAFLNDAGLLQPAVIDADKPMDQWEVDWERFKKEVLEASRAAERAGLHIVALPQPKNHYSEEMLEFAEHLGLPL
jgi:hypothetical protein